METLVRAEIWRGTDGQFHWRFKGRNGRTVIDAEAYTTRAQAIRAAKSAIKAIRKSSMPALFGVYGDDALSVLRWA